MGVLDETWNISQKGEEIITENNSITDKSALLKNALNSDLKEIGGPILAKYSDKTNISQVVLQIQKVRNISAPKSNENSQAAPRMLKLILTDGHTYIQAIEIAPIPSLSQEHTPPGSKLLIQSAKIASGYILLDSTNCTLLGGKVPSLYEKWELARSVRFHNRHASSSDGAPAWVNFGRKIQAENVQDAKFTSLNDKNQQAKENSKFDLQRQDAIAELSSGAVKKVFGGTAKQAPQEQVGVGYKKVNEPVSRERRNFKGKSSMSKEIEPNQKPPERVSLFDFLEDKLPPSEPPQTQNSSNYNRNSRNSSFYPDSAKQYINRKPPEKGDVFGVAGDTLPASEPPQTQNNSNYNRNNSKPHNSSFYSNNSKPVNQSQSGANNSYNRSSKQFHNGNNFNRQRTDKSVEAKPKENADVNGLSSSLSKMSINAQFASRSLKQHLNLETQKKTPPENANATVVDWKVGDECVAKYWEDGKFYNVIVTGVTDKTCVVKFKGYGNIEEVLKTDCLPSNRKGYNPGPPDFRKTRTYSRRQQF